MNQDLKDIITLKEQAILEAERLSAGLDGTKRVAFISCSYDTSFEPVEDQITEKVDQLIETFGLDEKIHWSLWVVDDLPEEEGFGRAVQHGFSALSERLGSDSRLKLLKLKTAKPVAGGLKGRALLDGMEAALKNDPGLSAVVYINLNLKVDAGLSTLGLKQVLCDGFDAAIGTRSPEKGGLVIGRGIAGNLKSRVFNLLVRMLLPPIKTYYDTNAPMKVYNPAAAGLLVRSAVLPTVSMDCEWLMLLHLNGYQAACFPIAWVQRFGSRPPWYMILSCFRDVLKLRKRWKQGLMSDTKGGGEAY
jgi:hypothetical protein